MMYKKILFVAIVIGAVLSLVIGDSVLNINVKAQPSPSQSSFDIPNQQTNGELLFLYANDTLGEFECSKNISLNSDANQACRDRPNIEGMFFGPAFSQQNISDQTTISDLKFWAEDPDEVFEINVNLHIPVSQTEYLVVPLRGYFYTDYMLQGMDYGPENATSNITYYGRGQVAIGGQYHKWNDGFSYGILIGGIQ